MSKAIYTKDKIDEINTMTTREPYNQIAEYQKQIEKKQAIIHSLERELLEVYRELNKYGNLDSDD